MADVNELRARFTLPERPSEPFKFPDPEATAKRDRAITQKQCLDLFEREIGPRYSRCRLNNFSICGTEEEQSKQAKAVEQLRSYAANILDRVAGGENLILLGGVGTGKDHLASALARCAIAQHGLNVCWSDGCRLFSMMRDSINLDRTEESLLAPLERADILYLSDPVPPDTELTAYQRQSLFRLIDRRYRHLRPTWLTCNFKDRTESVKFMSGSIVDRIRDSSTVINCDWSSHRLPLRVVDNKGERRVASR